MSERRLAILQPGYLPWLGFFDQMAKSDVFVFYDDVQFDKHGWRNRNRVKTVQGYHWLTVPVYSSGFPLVREVKIDNARNWGRKHLETLRQSYGKAPYFGVLYPQLEEVLGRPWELLMDLDVELVRRLAEMLGIRTSLVFSSDLDDAPPAPGGPEATQRLVDICRLHGATRYLTGDAARDYLDVSRFEAAGIEVEWHNYHHPEYSQQHGPFLSHLSVVDLMFNHGPESFSILRGLEAISRQPSAVSADG